MKEQFNPREAVRPAPRRIEERSVPSSRQRRLPDAPPRGGARIRFAARVRRLRSLRGLALI